MADWLEPALDQLWDDFLAAIKSRDVNAAQWFDPDGEPSSERPLLAKRWNDDSGRFQVWDGSAWENLSVHAGTIGRGVLDDARLPAAQAAKSFDGLTQLHSAASRALDVERGNDGVIQRWLRDGDIVAELAVAAGALRLRADAGRALQLGAGGVHDLVRITTDGDLEVDNDLRVAGDLELTGGLEVAGALAAASLDVAGGIEAAASIFGPGGGQTQVRAGQAAPLLLERTGTGNGPTIEHQGSSGDPVFAGRDNFGGWGVGSGGALGGSNSWLNIAAGGAIFRVGVEMLEALEMGANILMGGNNVNLQGGNLQNVNAIGGGPNLTGGATVGGAPIAGVAASGGAGITFFPVGHVVISNTVGNINRNATATVRLDTGNNHQYDTGGSGSTLGGTWRASGEASGDQPLRRVA